MSATNVVNAEVQRATFLGLPERQVSAAGPAVAILPVPFEGTVTYGRGTSEGPAAIIGASPYLEIWDPRFRLDHTDVDYRTLPPLDCSGRSSQEVSSLVKDEVAALVSRGMWVCMLGGEHSITVGAVGALAERRADFGVLQIDAHTDLRDEYEGNRYSHACVMRRVREIVGKTVAVGVRAISKEEFDYARSEGIALFHPWSLDGDWIDRVMDSLPTRVYLTLDVDGLDPSVIPGTGTPEPGGLDYEQVVRLLARLVEEKELVGFDIVEVAPRPGSTISEYTAACLAALVCGLYWRKTASANHCRNR